MTATRTWLDRLYGRSPGFFAVTAFKGGRPRATAWFGTEDLDRAEKVIIATGKRADVYASVATHEQPAEPGSRGGERSVVSIPGWWADLDIGELGHKPAALPNPPDETAALSIVEGLPAPSLLMHSGGGLQVFWLFDNPWVFAEPVDRSLAKEASRDWHTLLEQRAKAIGYHLDKTHSLDRILRVPGTYNHKAGLSRPVNARVLDGPSLPKRELASLGLPADDVEEAAGETKIDNFPLTWAQILEPHGWTRCGEHLWSRPGKGCSEGHSASTDPYGVPVLVNFSATTELPSGEGQKLTKLRVWAHLNYNGDLRAAKAALRKLQPSTMDDWTRRAVRFAAVQVDWETIWTEESVDPEWFVEPLIERGRQIAIYSEAKAGKSLLLLEIALALSTGRAVLGNGERKPVKVMYVDMENTRQDLRIRAAAMGYEGEVLSNLVYYSFPDLSYLDTEGGGVDLHALAKYHSADLVIIDTLSRVIEGEENANDTYHNFYKHTGVKLKAEGISLVRLDHSGKDPSRGMRGASSKTTDVDEVWQMLVDDELITLNRTHSRSHHGEDRVVLRRLDTPVLHHSPTGGDGRDDVEQIIVKLELLQVPAKASLAKANAAVEADGWKVARRLVDAAQKRRQELATVEDSDVPAGRKRSRV
jgi:AAA domain